MKKSNAGSIAAAAILTLLIYVFWGGDPQNLERKNPPPQGGIR